MLAQLPGATAGRALVELVGAVAAVGRRCCVHLSAWVVLFLLGCWGRCRVTLLCAASVCAGSLGAGAAAGCRCCVCLGAGAAAGCMRLGCVLVCAWELGCWYRLVRGGACARCVADRPGSQMNE